MPELDALKEELAYLRLWLGMLAVTHISFDWLDSVVRRDGISTIADLGGCCHHRARYERFSSQSLDRAPYRTHPEAKGLDLVIGILMLATALLFGGIARHAGREKKPPSRTTD